MDVHRSASFSRCKEYRYQLKRRWEQGTGRCVFIGLNPSTANASEDDPTIRRCMGFAQDWGFSELMMVNLFAYRTPHPTILKLALDPVGRSNGRVLRRACLSADLIIAAWGIHGVYLKRADKARSLLQDLPVYCFGRAGNGQPLHPLYQRKTAALCRYT
jgi:hypothetical protein